MRKIYALMVAASAFAVSAAAFADPPAMVGRLSYIEGSASIRHAYDGQWAPGAVNYPVVAGDAVWDADNSRTEIELPGGEARIDQLSELDLDQLDDNGTAVRLVQGVLNLTVRYVPRGGLAVTTSIGQVSILQPGEYHFDAGRPNGPPTQVLMGVLQGEALYGQTDLRGGQGVMAPPNSGEASVVSIYATSFDQWAESWALRLAPSAAQNYVAYDMTGYQDLSNNGVWEENPDLGAVWFPTTVEIGWAPYRYGHWEYVRPWGWTWIDRASWGFAPFHYGRWCQLDGRWGWVPGERHEHHVYAPALVAFVGGEPGEHMGAGIGWVPLGPHEVFHPYYPHSDIYVLNINRAHFHDEHDFREREAHWHDHDYTVDHFANHQAMTNVSTAAFVSREPVHQNMTSPQPMGPNRGPAPVMHDFDHLPQPQPHPQPVQSPQSAQPQQPQFRPNPAMGPQPLPQQDRLQPGRPQPERVDRPEPLQQRPQPVQEFRPQQPVQQPQPPHAQQPVSPQPPVQPQQPQFRPNPAMGPQPQFRPNPAMGPQPPPQQERPQPMPEYHAPQAVPQQQMPQFHPQPQPQPQPQPVQQPRPQPQQPSQQQSPQRRDDKDKREQH